MADKEEEGEKEGEKEWTLIQREREDKREIEISKRE